MTQQFRKLFNYFIIFWIIIYLVWYQLFSSLSLTILFNHLCILSILAIIAWTGAYRYYERSHSAERITNPGERTILITGCDTGFGNRVAQRLDQYGFHIVAGVLNPDSVEVAELKQKCSTRLQVVRMDVTSSEEVRSVVEKYLRNSSAKPLWAVVNNAGIGIFAPWDWGTDVDVYRKTFDVNVLGLVRVTKETVPLLRESPHGGRVVNVASLASRLSVNCMAAYCMSKHAVRSFSDAIRRELPHSTQRKPITVTTIEPTFYRTQLINMQHVTRTREQLRAQTDAEIVQAYPKNYLDKFLLKRNWMNFIFRTNTDEVVDAMVDSVTLKHEPKRFIRCCGYLDILFWIIAHGPEILLDYLMLWLYKNRYAEMIDVTIGWVMKKFK